MPSGQEMKEDYFTALGHVLTHDNVLLIEIEIHR